MDKNDAIAFTLFVVGWRDKKAHVQTNSEQNEGD
jgi:hypothetical protein